MNTAGILFLLYLTAVLIFCFTIFALLYLFVYIFYIFFFLPSNFEFKAFNFIGRFVKKIFTGVSKYFPVEFVKREAIDMRKKYLYVFVPHGLLTFSQVVHLFDDSSPLKELNMWNAAHSVIFRIPLVRELAMTMGVIPVEKSYLNYYLKEKSVSITVGGMREVSYALDDEVDDKLFIKNRKGFVKIARDGNVEIVPIYCWNEQQFITFRQNEWLDILGKIVSKVVGRSMELNFFQFLLPDKLIKVAQSLAGKIAGTKLYVGKPIRVDEGSVDEAHQNYIVKIQELFEYAAAKEKSGKKLIIE